MFYMLYAHAESKTSKLVDNPFYAHETGWSKIQTVSVLEKQIYETDLLR